MTLYKEPFAFDTSGRQSVQRRMQLLYGDDIYILKGKACLQTSIPSLVGYVLSPADTDVILGDSLYDDWAGEGNSLSETSQLIAVEGNKASCYLIFKQLS